jgi:hypothetical protein
MYGLFSLPVASGLHLSVLPTLSWETFCGHSLLFHNIFTYFFQKKPQMQHGKWSKNTNVTY